MESQKQSKKPLHTQNTQNTKSKNFYLQNQTILKKTNLNTKTKALKEGDAEKGTEKKSAEKKVVKKMKNVLHGRFTQKK